MKIVCGLAVITALAWGQDAGQPKETQKLIRLKFVDANSVASLLSVYMAGHGNIRPDERLRMISVSGPSETVAAVEDAIAKLDMPPTDFELTVYLISTVAQPGDQLPEALASTAKQLHGVFAYKGYQLLDSFVLRGRDGAQNGNAEGTIKNSTYNFRYNRASVLDGTPKIVNLQNLSLQIKIPSGMRNEKGQLEYKTTGVTTDIDIRDGQKVVVGKSDVNNGESPLILVVTAKVVE
jgi:hypothetical protein